MMLKPDVTTSLKIACVFAFCIGPAPLAAQTAQFDEGPLEACLSASGGLLEQKACVGAGSNDCMFTTEGGTSTAGMNTCLSLELGYWDTVLNTEYRRLVDEAAAFDAGLADPNQTFARLSDSLRDMQRAWITYRDASCAFDAAIWTNGTGASTAYIACEMQMTGDRALELQYTSLKY